MNKVTNRLVDTLRRVAIPAAAVPAAAIAVTLGAAVLGTHYADVHAASAAVSPIDDSSVSALESLDNAVEAVAARVTPTVVNVSVTARPTSDDDDQAEGGPQGMQPGPQGMQPGQLPPGLQQFFFGGPMAPQQQQQNPVEHAVGSGVIISPDGYILTNNHVVNGAVNIQVTLDDRRVFPAKLVGADKLTDLAVLKIDATKLPFIGWGNSQNLHPGQTVLAFGSPFGYFRFSVTRGIVSAINRPNPFTNDPRKPGGFIQTDAAINPGNSGGPLVNARGELVGINTFIISNSGSFAGAGFAIPAQIAQSISQQIIAHGAVHHGYLGITLNDVTPQNASFFNLPDASGAIISQVAPSSPASEAGLKQGDVIRSLNGNRIESGSDLQVDVSEMTPGNKISLGVVRDGKSITIPVSIGEYHNNAEVADNGDGASMRGARLGLAVTDLSPDVRGQLNLPDQVNGVAVANVKPGSPADEAGIAPGDVILQLDRKPVTSAQQFASSVHAMPANQSVMLLVWSRGGTTYRVLQPSQSIQNGD